MTDPPPQLYAKHLLPYCYGYPLWTPEPSHEHLMRRRNGLQIGDVGVIDLENGSFDVFFNICLPHDHPLHRATGVPDNFTPIQLDDWDIASYPHAEYPGRVISSSSVTAKTIEQTGEAALRPFTYDFNLSSSEGALLILSKGAESRKLRKLRKRQLFKDIATRNADDWYNFAESNLGRIITHDSLYLITGLYKTRSWSVAAFHEATGTSESSAQFKASQTGEGNDNDMSYSWETMRALDWRVGPQLDVDIPNQSVFISGFKIALREGILGKKWVEVEVDSPSIQSRSVKFSNGHGGSSSRTSRSGNLWSRLLSRSGSSGTKSTKRTARSSLAARSDDAGDTQRVTIDHVPRPLQSLHPSDIINRYMLTKESSASVAITHDTQWIVLLEKGLLKPEDLGHNDRLEKIVSDNYRLISREGVVYLQAVWDSSMGLKNIDDAAHEAWREDRLDDAEEILSGHVLRHPNTDYHAFASRALIRARLRNWNAALRDAETSIDIQPSVVAQVAKGFALFGSGKYELAVEAFKVAIQQCDVDGRDIVSLTKLIVLFEVGYHAESMAGIADLIERCPVEVKSTCSFVQAVMYVRLGALATKNEDYNKALQLLTRSRSLGPFHATPDLKIITLICGWRFDNIPFTIRRQECEALLIGRIDEAVELFRTVRRDFGEDVRTSKDNAEWITSFSQQCLRALESLGDCAMSLQSYNEAITRYSTAMTMGPITREHFLAKRSKAYAAARAWGDALRDADEAIDLNPLSLPGHESKHQALYGMGRREEANQTFDRMISIATFKRSGDAQTQYPYLPHGNPSQLIGTTHTSSSHMLTVNHPPRIGLEQSSAANSVARVQDLDTQPPGQPESVRIQAESIGQIPGFQSQLGLDMTTGERGRVLRDHLSDVLSMLLRFPQDQEVTTSGEDVRGQNLGITPAPLHTREQMSNVVTEGARRSVATLPELLHDIHTQRSLRPLSSDDSQDSTSVNNRRPRPYDPQEACSSTPPSSSYESDNESAHLPHMGQTIVVVPPPAHPPVTLPIPGNGESSIDSLITSSDTQIPYQEGVGRRRRDYSPPSQVYMNPMAEDVPSRQRERGSTRRTRSKSARRPEYHRRPGRTPGWYQVPYGEPVVPPPAGMGVHIPPPPPPPPPGAFVQPFMYPMTPPAPVLTQPQLPFHDMLMEILREQRYAHRASVDQQEELTRQLRSMSEWMMRETQDRLSELRGMTSRMYTHLPRSGETGFTHTQPYHSVGTAGPGVSPFWQSWPAQWSSQATPFHPIPPNATPFSTTPHGSNPFGPSPFSTMPFGPTSNVPHSWNAVPSNTTPHGLPPGFIPFGPSPFSAIPSGSTSYVANSFGAVPSNGTPFSAYHPGSTPFDGTPYTTPFVPSEPSPYFTSPPPGSGSVTPLGMTRNSEHVSSPASGSSSPPGVTIEPPTPGWSSNSTPTSSQALPAPVATSASASTANSLLLRSERESPISEVATLVQSPTAAMGSPLSKSSTKIGVPDSPQKSRKFEVEGEEETKLTKLRGKRRLGQVSFGEVTYI